MQLELHQLDPKFSALRVDDPGRRSQMVASLAKHGQQMPVVVIRTDRADRFVLIDGYVRMRALKDLSRDIAVATVVTLPEDMALVMSHGLQQARKPSALEEGWLLDELTSQHGHEAHALSVMLGRSRSWISRRMSLVRVLPQSVQDAVRQGRLNAHDAMKVLVPLARANAEQCETLVSRLPRRAPTSRQMEKLYQAWRRGDAEVRTRIVENPTLYFKVEARGLQAPDAAKLLRDLQTIAAVSARATKRATAAEDAPFDVRKRLHRVLDEARSAFGSLVACMPQERG